MEAQHPLIALIRSVIRLAEALGETVTAAAVARARGSVSDYFETGGAWETLIALAAEMGPEAVAAYLFGAEFPEDEMHFALAVLLFVAGGGEPSEGRATAFPA